MPLIVIKYRDRYISICGHAGYGEPGADIVCAAISALTQTLVWSLEELTKDEVQGDLMPGLAEISYRDLSERACVLVDSFFIGVRLVEREFPNYVRVESLSEMT